MEPLAGGDRGPVSRILPSIIPRISKTLRHRQSTPPSPSHCEIDLEAANPARHDDHNDEKQQPQVWNSTTKSAILKQNRGAAVNKPQTTPLPRTLMTLPPELQALVLSYLEFPDIVRLRRTSIYWRKFASPQLLRTIHGPTGLFTMLIHHCRDCLTYLPQDTSRIFTKYTDPGYPLSSRCIPCTLMQSRSRRKRTWTKDDTNNTTTTTTTTIIRVGKKVKLGDGEEYWPCRWCGWPVIGNAYRTTRNVGHSEFHQGCYERYFFIGVFSYLLMGCVQFAISVTGAALVWRYFDRSDVAVVVPTAMGFVLAWVCIYLLASRDCYAPTYTWNYGLALAAELGILASWVNPMRVLLLKLMQGGTAANKAILATLVFVALNVLFRLLNVLGDILLLSGYDRTQHHLPRVPVLRRVFVNPVLTGLLLWTYPQHIYSRFPSPDSDDSAEANAD